MRSRRRLYPVLAALGLVLSACGAPEEGEANTAEVGSQDGLDQGAAEDVDLAVAPTDLGEVLVDGDGRTLYVFDEDPRGESVCVDSCLEAWPAAVVDRDPLVAPEVDQGLVSTIERADDGTMQLTYGGAPLYTWISDQQPGDVTGQGVEGVWYVVAPDGQPITNDEVSTSEGAMDEEQDPTDDEGGSGPYEY